MNIGKLSQHLGASGLPAASTGGEASKKKQVDSTVSSTNVSRSPLAEKLLSLANQYGGQQPFDSVKVASLKAAIADGTFKVDASVVADGLLAEARAATKSTAR